MKKIFHLFSVYKYSFLFSTILLILLVAPLITDPKSFFLPLIFLLMILGVLGTLKLPKPLFLSSLALGFLSFFLDFISKVFSVGEDALLLGNIVLIGYSIFLLIAIWALLSRIFVEKEVTFETIKGGISVYFLMGIFWAFLYQIVLLADPNALFIANPSGKFSDVLYFSFITLTTLGYGDITPVTSFARNLTILESTLGQIFITVLIARLVGLHISRSR